MDRNEEIIKKITHDIYRKYKDKMVDRVDVYAEERDALSKVSDIRARKLANSKQMNEVREVVNEKIEKRMDRELTGALNRELKRGTIKTDIKKYR